MAEVEFVQVSTTTGSRDAAVGLVHSAVEARLAACGQIIGPITSVYWWQAGIDEAQEWLVVFKTAADRASGLVEHLRFRHPYDVPEIICVPVTGGNPAYLEWVWNETHQRQGKGFKP